MRPDLMTGVQAERKRLQQLVSQTYPNPDAGADDRTKFSKVVDKYDYFLGEFANPDNRKGDWLGALGYFKQGEFDAAVGKIPGPSGAGANGEGKDEEERNALDALLGHKAGPLQESKWFLIRHASVFIGLLIGLGFLLLGLETVFKGETMFLNNDFQDFITLTAWGFASAVVGSTATDLAAKVKPAGS